MALNAKKNVKFSENQRLDLDDVNALSQLKDEDWKTFSSAMLTPGEARVFFGLSGRAVNTQFLMDNVAGLAHDVDGNLLVRPAPGLDYAIPGIGASALYYIHAYVYDLDSDNEIRKFRGDAAPYAETDKDTPTRSTKAVDFYLTSVPYATVPSLAGFSAATVVNGQTVKLIPLYAAKYNGAAFTSVQDFRPMWLPNGVQAAHQADEVGTFAFGITDGDRNVKSIRSMFLFLAKLIRDINGNTGKDWWTIAGKTLKDLVEFCTVEHIWTAIQTFRGTPDSDGAAAHFDGAIVTRKLQFDFGVIGGFWMRGYSESSNEAFVITFNARWNRATDKWVADQTEFTSWMLKYSTISGLSLFDYTADDRMAYGMTWDDWGDPLGVLGIAGLGTGAIVSTATVTAESHIESLHGDLKAGGNCYAPAFKRSIEKAGLEHHIIGNEMHELRWYSGVENNLANIGIRGTNGGTMSVFTMEEVNAGCKAGMRCSAHLPPGAVITEVHLLVHNNNVQQTIGDLQANLVKPSTGESVSIAYEVGRVIAANAGWQDLNITNGFVQRTVGSQGYSIFEFSIFFYTFMTSSPGIQFRDVKIVYKLPANLEILPEN